MESTLSTILSNVHSSRDETAILLIRNELDSLKNQIRRLSNIVNRERCEIGYLNEFNERTTKFSERRRPVSLEEEQWIHDRLSISIPSNSDFDSNRISDRYLEATNVQELMRLESQVASVKEYRELLIADLQDIKSKMTGALNKMGVGKSRQLDLFSRLQTEELYREGYRLLVAKKFENNLGYYRCEQYAIDEIDYRQEAYVCGFDGKNFVECEIAEMEKRKTKETTSFFIFRSSSPFILSTTDPLLIQCRKLLTTIPWSIFDGHRTTVVKWQGVPGCGKTTKILNNVNIDDAILTITKANCQEILQRLKAKEVPTRTSNKDHKNGVLVATIDSYFLNSMKHEKSKRIKTLYIDEALMAHAGSLHLILSAMKSQTAILVGDINQLNYVNRQDPWVKAEFSIFVETDETEMDNLSRRCPQDVAALFSSFYPSGFFTTSTVRYSMFVRNISDITDPEQLNRIRSHLKEGAKVMTFSREEKNYLNRVLHIMSVNTVHECQGLTVEIVVLVRYIPHRCDLYKSMPHILVALTRHTKQLWYYTVCSEDATATAISRAIPREKVDLEEITACAASANKSIKAFNQRRIALESVETSSTLGAPVNVANDSDSHLQKVNVSTSTNHEAESAEKATKSDTSDIVAEERDELKSAVTEHHHRFQFEECEKSEPNSRKHRAFRLVANGTEKDHRAIRRKVMHTIRASESDRVYVDSRTLQTFLLFDDDKRATECLYRIQKELADKELKVKWIHKEVFHYCVEEARDGNVNEFAKDNRKRKGHMNDNDCIDLKSAKRQSYC